MPSQPRDTRRSRKTALPLAIDDVVDGRYAITGIVGRGGFGAVYSARHLVSGADVAIKVLLNRTQGNRDEAVERFFKEAKVLARLRHPNTVRVHDVGYTEAGDLYFAMELLQGPNLEQVFAAVGRAGRVMTEAQAIDTARPMLGALGEAHKLDLVHRDLKPANVVLAHVPNEPFCVKVLDFGVVRTADSDLTTKQTALGTPIYMSPEQCRSQKIDGRADLYAVGVILFEAVCGHTPFPPGNPVDVMFEQMESPVPDLRKHSRQKHSPAFRLLLRKALAKDPDRRFQSAAEMRRALDVIRRESWGDVPVTNLDDLLTENDQVRLSSPFKVVVGDARSERGHTEAGVRAGKSGGVEPMAAREDHTIYPQGRNSTKSSAPPDTRVDLDRPSASQTHHDPAARLPDADDAGRPHSPSARPQRRASRPYVESEAPVRLPTARPAPKWNDDSRAALRPTDNSQQVMRLPSQTQIERAIERHVAEKTRRKSDGPRPDPRAEARRDPGQTSPDRNLQTRPPQMAPPGADDELPDAPPGRRGRGRRTPKLGKGTIIGTGFKIPTRDDDD